MPEPWLSLVPGVTFDLERPIAPASDRKVRAAFTATWRTSLRSSSTWGLGPTWIAGNSFGGSITLRLAAQRPDLLRGVIVHEPPLLSLLSGNREMEPLLWAQGDRIAAVVNRISVWVITRAPPSSSWRPWTGRGAWAQLPPEAQQIMIVNAPTFLDEANDPDQLAIDLGGLAGFPKPALLTKGALSPPMFAPIVDQIATALRAADLHFFPPLYPARHPPRGLRGRH